MADYFWKVVTVACMSVVAAYTGALLGDRIPPIELISGHVSPEVVSPGDEITVRWEMKKTRNCRRQVSRFIVYKDGSMVPLDDSAGADVNVGELVKKITVPLNTPPGPTRYRSITKFYCNPFHDAVPIITESPDLAFTVVPK